MFTANNIGLYEELGDRKIEELRNRGIDQSMKVWVMDESLSLQSVTRFHDSTIPQKLEIAIQLPESLNDQLRRAGHGARCHGFVAAFFVGLVGAEVTAAAVAMG